ASVVQNSALVESRRILRSSPRKRGRRARREESEQSGPCVPAASRWEVQRARPALLRPLPLRERAGKPVHESSWVRGSSLYPSPTSDLLSPPLPSPARARKGRGRASITPSSRLATANTSPRSCAPSDMTQ